MKFSRIRCKKVKIIAIIIAVLLCFPVCGCTERIIRGQDTQTAGPALSEDEITTQGKVVLSEEQITDSRNPSDNGSSITIAPEITTGGSISIGQGVFDNADSMLYMDILKTGKSDCIIIRMDDIVIMVDTADEDDYGKISSKLQELGIGDIDYMILTHFDDDHIGSAGALFRNYTVKNLIMPSYTRVSDYFRAINAALATSGNNTECVKLTDDKIITTEYGEMIINPTHLYDSLGDVVIDSDNDNVESEENNFSLITQITYGKYRLLLTGDAEKERIAEYMELCAGNSGKFCSDFDFIKLPHHGSYNTQLRKLLSDGTPQFGVVCAVSSYSVESELELRMDALKAEMFYTFNGDLLLRTDGVNIRVTQQ